MSTTELRAHLLVTTADLTQTWLRTRASDPFFVATVWPRGSENSRDGTGSGEKVSGRPFPVRQLHDFEFSLVSGSGGKTGSHYEEYW